VVRTAALLAALAALAIYSAIADGLPESSDWIDVIVVSTLVLPLTFAPVWLALPVRKELGSLRLAFLAIPLVVMAVLLSLADLEIPANLAKLAAATVVGWWFLTFFEAPWWVLLVALFIVPVDLLSVARGPTREITEERPEVFDALSIFIAVPGEENVAQLGLPDVLFFALFLGACVRFGLRRDLTWLTMTLSFGATLGLAVYLEEAGVAALPLLAAAFVLPNADLLWRSIRRKRPEPSLE
jgi:hypothetical protein